MKPKILFHLKKDKTYDLDFVPLNKFKNDCVYIENNDFLLILEGVIVNMNEFLKKDETLESFIINHLQQSTSFLNKLRGSFYYLYYNKKTNELETSTDQWSSKFLFYSTVAENEILISDSLNSIYKKRKSLGYKNTFDVEAAYMLLTFAYMLEDKTLESDTHKIAPGTLINFSCDGVITNETWYKFPISSWDGNLNEKDIIEELDYNFKKYTARSFSKDLEYNYRHLVGLSGGLDSRMVSWVGNELGFVNQTNFTFSQSNYLDQEIANNIAVELNHEWLFKALDNGLFLQDIDNGVKIVGGNVSFIFTAHSNYMLKDINFNDYGVIHNGQNGEDAIGCPISAKEDLDMKNYKYHIGYSTRFIDKIPTFSNIDEKYANSELLWNYTRCINGSNVGLRSSQQYSEAITPFMDIDFNEYCFSIPMKYRAKHNLYKKWILEKHPGAAKYKWEKNNKLISYKPQIVKIKGKEYDLKSFHRAILFKLKLIKPSLETKNHMNPIDYWYINYLKITWDNYFNQNIELLTDFPELKTDIENYYKSGSAINKSQCLTLLSAYKLYFA